MKRITSVLVCLLFLGISVMAQDIQITGKVTSADDGSPLPGVAIIIQGTQAGTSTDIDGNYSISAPSDATLVFNFVGMISQEIAVSGRTVIDVVMETDALTVDEVVVTAMGFKQEKRSLSYSAQTVDDEEINAASQIDVTRSLQGKIAGVTVRQSSGMPGASSYILIRGANSFDQNNEPLYVVDGMPIESGSIFTEAITQDRVSGTDAASRSIDINPADIESITTLKGAAAAAEYGLRAANGVIVITTKSGQGLNKDKGSIEFTTSYTVDNVTRLPELQEKYAQGSNGAFNPNTSLSWGPEIEDLGTYYLPQLGDSVVGQKYDNVDPFFETGAIYTADLGVNRSSDVGNYRVSVGYLSHKGVVPNTDMYRYTGGLKGEYNVTDKIKVGGSAKYAHTDNNKIANGSNLSNPLFTVYYAPRSYDLWGLPYAEEDDPYAQIHYRSAMDNPRWSLEHNKFNEKNDRFISNGFIEYNILDFLQLKYQLGIDNIVNQQKEFYDLGSGETGGRATALPSGGSLTDYAYLMRDLNSNLSLRLNKKFGDFGVNAIVGNEIYDHYAREFIVEATDFNIGGLENLSITSNQVNIEYIYKKRTIGLYGIATLDYKSMIYLTFKGRNDRVSNLAKGNRSYFYPSVGTGIVFTEMADIDPAVLSFGKIRASWSQVGKAVDQSYATQNVFVKGNPSSGFLTDGIEFPLGGINGFSHYFEFRTEDLKPQNSVEIELGLELGFINNRLYVDYAYFSTVTEDQIFAVPISPSTGYQQELRNAGKMETVGHEFTLKAVPVVRSGFKWNIVMNFTKYTNEVVELAEGVNDIYLGGFTTPSIRAIPGNPYPSVFGIGYLRDDNGNIVVLDDPFSPYHGMPLSDPVSKRVGDVQPNYVVGFSNTFEYKGIVVTALIDWQQGGEMYSGNNRLGRLYGALSITEDRETPVILDAVKGYLDGNGDLVVTGENDIAIVKDQRYWNDVLGDIDEAHVHETSYVRFRELSVGYAFPKNILGNSPITGLKVSLVGRNLALWSNYPNFDPETSTTGSVNGQGIEYVALPQIMSIGGRINVTF